MALKAGWEGRFFEDFQVGDVYRSSIGRTLLEADNTWMTLLTNNDNQIHFNAEYAKNTQFKRPLMNSLVTLAVVTASRFRTSAGTASTSAGTRYACRIPSLRAIRCGQRRRWSPRANRNRTRAGASYTSRRAAFSRRASW